ncbi:hypothetical protein HMPREF0833_11206 [Streptococcus parasanguinis ATCC 15912]|uniref:Uncharacterized protein n=1 Tax=Streptococcus parasanguinis (strain ATCC 15912 / DSM 6778 / CIP 104372 / LMG 14537) TaxID=760570 RepID=F8DK85_STREP|nr:hypothetical protein HMPREF0833_11206 [Streptococcus parasanguinis ATCC 15912]
MTSISSIIIQEPQIFKDSASKIPSTILVKGIKAFPLIFQIRKRASNKNSKTIGLTDVENHEGLP